MDDYRARLASQLPEIRRTVRRLGGSYGLSDDVTQECCVRILEKEGLWQGSQAEGWMGVISRNLALTLRGKASRVRSMEKPLEVEPVAPEVSEDFPEERIRWVLSQFASLPTKQREVLKMRYFENLSNTVIAERMGVSEPTVSIHHARALETLKGRARRAGWVGLVAWLGTWKAKAAAAIAIVAAAGGAAAYFYETDPSTHLIVKSTELKRTIITPHMDCPMQEGKNVLYCATFQLAWDEMKALAGGNVKLDKPWDMADRLNSGGPSKTDLPAGSYVAMAGFGKDGIVDKIQAELEKTFRQGKDPCLESAKHDLIFLAYAFLARDLPFKHPFGPLKKPLSFGVGKEPVQAFGFDAQALSEKAEADLFRQVQVYGYADAKDAEYVVTLQPAQEGEEILLAHVAPRKTLLETVQAALAIRKASKGETIDWEGSLKVPLLDFDIRHDFQDLVGKITNIPGLRASPIDAAFQSVRLKLDEKGAVLHSRAEIVVLADAPNLDFSSAFLLLLRRKDSAQPYLALWVDNAEVLVGEKKMEKTPAP